MNVEIAQRLAARRKQAGLSQEALAGKLGVSRQAVSKWERSESSPDTDNLIALAQLYGVSLDELLYVDEDMRDDVAFEASDRAADKREAASGGNAGGVDASEVVRDSASSGETPKARSKVQVGFDGVRVHDGDDYVCVSWSDGVHVRDAADGGEVHVDWDGVRVAGARDGRRTRRARGRDDRASRRRSREGGGPAGEWFGFTADGVGGRDDDGNEFRADAGGVTVNGEHFDSWREAHERYGHGWDHGRAYADWSAAHPKAAAFLRSWNLFPFPLVVVVAYLAVGILCGMWGPGLFLLFAIPLYYLMGDLLARHRVARFVAGAYPLCATAWFCHMAFVVGQPHPAWAVFLTIPVAEALVQGLSRWWRGGRRSVGGDVGSGGDADGDVGGGVDGTGAEPGNGDSGAEVAADGAVAGGAARGAADAPTGSASAGVIDADVIDVEPLKVDVNASESTTPGTSASA